MQFVLLLFGAISLFWFAGQLIDHAVINGDDWGIIARRNQWPPLWRPVSITIGGTVYILNIAFIASVLGRRGALRNRAIVLAYIAGAVSARNADLFSLSTTITLYDLTNTYFEGEMAGNPEAKRGHSKEKRTDCPLVIMDRGITWEKLPVAGTQLTHPGSCLRTIIPPSFRTAP